MLGFTLGRPGVAGAGKNQLAVGAQHSSIESLALQTSDTAFLYVKAPGKVLEKPVKELVIITIV